MLHFCWRLVKTKMRLFFSSKLMDHLIPTCGSQVKKPCLDENCHSEPTKEPPQGWRRGSSQSGSCATSPTGPQAGCHPSHPPGKPGKPKMVAPPASTPSEPATCAQNGPSTSPPQGDQALRIQSKKLSMRCQHQSCKFSCSALLTLRC